MLSPKPQLALITTSSFFPVTGGAQEVNVPRFLQSQAALTDEQAVEMANLALSLEKVMGWPGSSPDTRHARTYFP